MEESRQDDTGSAYGAKRSLLRNFTKQSKAYHDRIPYVNKLPFSAIAVIVLVGCVNAIVWAAVGVVLVSVPFFPEPCSLLTVIQRFHPSVLRIFYAGFHSHAASLNPAVR